MWKKSLMLVAMVAVTGMLMAADGKKGAKCPVSGKKANPEACAMYKGAKVCFCCENCLAAFKKNTAKFAPKANMQLVATGQAVQEKCPFSGGKIKDGTEVTVDGVTVKFCCNNCQKKANNAKDKIALIFGDKAFNKGFKVKK